MTILNYKQITTIVPLVTQSLAYLLANGHANTATRQTHLAQPCICPFGCIPASLSAPVSICQSICCLSVARHPVCLPVDLSVCLMADRLARTVVELGKHHSHAYVITYKAAGCCCRYPAPALSHPAATIRGMRQRGSRHRHRHRQSWRERRGRELPCSRQVDERIDSQSDKQAVRATVGQAIRQTDRQINGQADGMASNRQTTDGRLRPRCRNLWHCGLHKPRTKLEIQVIESCIAQAGCRRLSWILFRKLIMSPFFYGSACGGGAEVRHVAGKPGVTNL